MLSKKCQYGLHALKYLSQQPAHESRTIQEIADKEKIPKKFLEVILNTLKKEGVVSSKRGKAGGYFLNRSPWDITVLQVIRILDGAVSMLPCVSLNFHRSCHTCEDESLCGLHRVFSRVRDETLKILSSTSIADLEYHDKVESF